MKPKIFRFVLLLAIAAFWVVFLKVIILNADKIDGVESEIPQYDAVWRGVFEQTDIIER